MLRKVTGSVTFCMRRFISSFPHTLWFCVHNPSFPDHPNLTESQRAEAPAAPSAQAATTRYRQVCLCTSKKGSFPPGRCSCVPSDFQFARPLGRLQKCVEPQAGCGREQSSCQRAGWATSLGGPAASPSLRTAEQGAGHVSESVLRSTALTFGRQFRPPSPFSEAWEDMVPTTGVLRALTSQQWQLLGPHSPGNAHGITSL